MATRITRKLSNYTKHLISVALSKEKHPNYGKPRSAETKKRISESLKKYWTKID